MKYGFINQVNFVRPIFRVSSLAHKSIACPYEQLDKNLYSNYHGLGRTKSLTHDKIVISPNTTQARDKGNSVKHVMGYGIRNGMESVLEWNALGVLLLTCLPCIFLVYKAEPIKPQVYHA